MSKKWIRGDDLYEGLQRLRDKSADYLPKEVEETDTNYKMRINRSVLFNTYRRTLQTLIGVAFSSPVTVSNVPPELQYLEYNADGSGRSITEVAADLFFDSIHYGLSHVFVDFPNSNNIDEDMSLPEYEALNLRPYFIPVNPKSVIGWKVDYQSGIEVLKNIRILETLYEENENFEEETVQYIKYITPEQVVTYRADVENPDFEVVNVNENSLNKIPLITIYSNKKAPLYAEPLLSDLIELNLAHYQTISTQANCLHFARLPILLATGFGDDADSFTIASNTLIMNSDPSANLRFVELHGSSISSGRQHGMDLESYMARSGAEVLFSASVSRQTATARLVDQKESLSITQLVIRSIEQALEQAYGIAGEWLGLENVNVSVSIGSDLNLVSDPNPSSALVELQKLFGMDDAQLLEEAKRRGLLASHIKEEDINVNNFSEQQSNTPVQQAIDNSNE